MPTFTPLTPARDRFAGYPAVSLAGSRRAFAASIAALFTAGLLTLAGPGTALAQDAPARGNNGPRQSPNAMVAQTFGTTEAVITYGRPLARDRQIFGGLVPYGQVWRTGANESTNLATTGDLLVTDAAGESHRIPAGVHSVYTLPSEDGNWTVILNANTSWGTQYDASGDVLRFSAAASEAPYTEQFTILFEAVNAESGTLVMMWETTRVAIPVSVPAAE